MQYHYEVAEALTAASKKKDIGRSGVFMEAVCEAIDPDSSVSPSMCLEWYADLLKGWVPKQMAEYYRIKDDDAEWKDAEYIFENIRATLTCLLPKSRELSLALTKLDEAQMWADKGRKNKKNN